MNRSSDRIGISIGSIFATVVLALPLGCRSLPASTRPTPSTAPSLSSSSSLDARRMYRGRTDSGETYTAVWDTRPDPVVVGLEEWAAALSGRTFTVELRDSAGNIVRNGAIQCSAYNDPYCLVEVRTDSPDLPASYHNKWILAVAFLNEKHPLDAAKPLRWSGHFKRDPDDSLFNYISIEPVQWEDDHKTIRIGYGIFVNDDHLEMRFVEKAMSDAKLSE